MTGEAVQRLAALKVRGLGCGGGLFVALEVVVALPFLSLVGWLGREERSFHKRTN